MFAVAYVNFSILVTFFINRIVKYRFGEKCYLKSIIDCLFLKILSVSDKLSEINFSRKMLDAEYF